MKQMPLPLFEIPPRTIVNVSSVPHRSPFRYPGGKTWLVPAFRQWMLNLQASPEILIEPFAGGGIIGLTAVFEALVDHAVFVELDEQVAVVWQTILDPDDSAWLTGQIAAFNMTLDNVNALMEQNTSSRREKALQTIVKNRIQRGGILAAGAGKIKKGESGRGLTSRWYPQTLIKRIQEITALRTRMTFIHGDGIEWIQAYKGRRGAAFFIDPPYTASGKKPGTRLYNHAQINHEILFELMAEVEGVFLMTYDDDPFIQQLARQKDFLTRHIVMKTTHHRKQTELVISRDMRWLD